MRRSDPFLFAASLSLSIGLLGGCSEPKVVPVWVDLDRLVSTAPSKEPPPPVMPTPPAPRPAISIETPGRPPELLSDPSHASKGSVKASIEEQQKAALASLQKRLQDYYENQALQFQVELQKHVSDTRMAAYDKASQQIRDVFVSYAHERGPKVLKLTVLVGFPDPNPDSKPPKTKVKTFMQKMLDEAKELRGEIKALDDAFDKQANAILATVSDSTAQEEAEMRKKVEDFRDLLNQKAAEEAANEVRTSVKDLGLVLTEPSPVFAPGTDGKTIRMPAEPPMSAPPQVPSEGIPRGVDDRRKLAQHELSIWLGLNRYRLERGATDKTEEFNQWRKQYRAGL